MHNCRQLMGRQAARGVPARSLLQKAADFCRASDYDEIPIFGLREACVGRPHVLDAAGVLPAQDPEEALLSPGSAPTVGNAPILLAIDAPSNDLHGVAALRFLPH